ncbi:MAG: protein translocase subunit SecF [Candidatus Shapirobacteria bacterium]|nr:protein translocase subunit SecF [Candidatus Shapirobacteria bacterium]
MINVMKFRPLFLFISLSLILVSTISIIKWNFVKGIDFVGGTVWEIKFSVPVDQKKIENIFSGQNIKINTISLADNTANIKFQPISNDAKTALDTEIAKLDPKYTELRFETLGPSLGRELLQKTIMAVILSSFFLLLFIGSRFKDVTFGLAAILAMFHDTFILIGAFSVLGHFFGAELDSLFVTALLTTLSASVHDTVVTFDRIRELKRKNIKIEWVTLANTAVSEVIVRSINNSMTIIFMLLALVVLGGDTTRWFAMALLIGVICGTYSSTGVAIPLVLFFKSIKKKS